MTTFGSIITSLISTAAFIACLWWAYWALRKLNIPQRYNLPVAVLILVVLVVGGTAYTAVSRVLSDFYSLFYRHTNGWIKAFSVIEALAALAFVGWLYRKSTLDQ
jgi:hypothetical protein